MNKWFLYFFALMVLFSVASAYTISGNKVIEEDAVSKLVVYPHTAWNPTGRNLVQTFELTNKTAADANVFIAYKFDNSLISGEVSYFSQPVYGLVTESKFCASPLVYDANIGLYPTQTNSNRIRCYRVDDRNTAGNKADDRNVLLFDLNFNTYDIPTARIDTDYNRIVSGNSYSNVSNLFSSAGFLNDTIYYLASPVLFKANSTETWRIKYTPNPLDKTNKWEMVFYTGTDASCILFNTCSYSHWLDPWYDVNYTVRYPITIGATHSAIDGNYTFALTGFSTTVSNCFDKNSVAVVWSKNSVSTVLNADVNGVCGGDFNIFWKSQFGIPANTALTSSDSNGYFIYLNSSAISNAARDLNGDNVYLVADTMLDADLNRPQWFMNNSSDKAPSIWLKTTGGFDDPFFVQPPTPNDIDLQFATLASKRASYSAWVKYTVSDTASFRFVVGVLGGSSPIYVNLRENSTGRVKYFDSAYRDFSPATALTLNSWYKIEARYIDGNNLVDYYLYDDHLNLVATALNATTQGSATATIDKLAGENGATTDSKFDKFIARLLLAVEPTLTVGLGQVNLGVPDLNLATPNGNNYLSLVNVNSDGNHSIDFNVRNSDNNYLRLRVYRSATRGAFSTLLYDQNLSYFAQNPTADMNCGAASIDFTSQRVCHLDWNIMDLFIGDGNFFLDLNVATFSTDSNQTASSLTAFVIDTNKPFMTWDGNLNWQRTDANVHLTCVDTGGCDSTKLFYRRDSDATSTVSLGAATLFDKNVFFRVASGDGNFQIDFNATDLAGNVSDLNTQFVLLDNSVPTIANSIPAATMATSSTTFSFVFIGSDGNGSGLSSCDYNAYVNNTVIAGQQNVAGIISGNQCTISFGYSPIAGQNIDVNARFDDAISLRSSTLKSFAYTYTPSSSPPSTGGGGGGGTPPAPDIVVSSLVDLAPTTYVLVLNKATPKYYIVTVTSKSDQNIALKISFSTDVARFVQPSMVEYTLSPKEVKAFQFSVQNQMGDQFSDLNGVVTFTLNNGQNAPTLPLKLQYSAQQDLIGDILAPTVFGFPIAYLLGALVFVWYVSSRT